MARYKGPRVRIVRRLGFLPGLTRKSPKNRSNTPGQHGKPVFAKSKRSTISDDYKNRLLEKQKLRFNYGVTEKKLVSYYHNAKRKRSSTGTTMLEMLEARLDCVLFRLGFAPTIPAARQVISHGHILVNRRLVNIPSFQCQKEDLITINSRTASQELVLGNFKLQQEKRRAIQRRVKRIKLARSQFRSLLPKHLELYEEDTVFAKVCSPVKRKDVVVRIDDLKVVEYYSR